MLRLALFQPDQPGNTGTLLRTAACFGLPVDIIEPCGFPFSDRALARAGMDYIGETAIMRHLDWAAFASWRQQQKLRLVLLTTRASTRHVDFQFAPGDVLLAGQESAGVPDHVHSNANAAVKLPMIPGLRSLNVAIATAMVLGEALRQTEGYA